jgi:hypothetical protein
MEAMKQLNGFALRHAAEKHFHLRPFVFNVLCVTHVVIHWSDILAYPSFRNV